MEKHLAPLPISVENFFRECKSNKLNLAECIDKYEITQQQAHLICDTTYAQAECDSWFAHRKLRVSSSFVHDIVELEQVNDKKKEKLFSKILDKVYKRESPISGFDSIAMQYGTANEDKVREQYQEQLSHEHPNLTVHIPGLIIDPKQKFLATSIDGLVKCPCFKCPKIRGLEIKCPYYYRNRKIAEIIATDKTGSFIVDSHHNINKNHRYYNQVQFQMEIAKLETVDLVIYTSKPNRSIASPRQSKQRRRLRFVTQPKSSSNMLVINVKRDHDRGQYLVDLANVFLMEHVYPHFYDNL